MVRLLTVLLLLNLFPYDTKAQDTTAYHNILIGFAFFERGYFDSAIHYYDKYLEIDKSYPDAYYYKGAALWKAMRLRDALKNFNIAISMNPDDPDYFGERGAVYAGLRQFDKARADFTRAIQHDPWNPQRYFNRGYLNVETQDCKAAIEDFSKAIELVPDYITARKFRSECYLELGETELALKDLTDIINLDNRSFDPMNRTNFMAILADALYSRSKIYLNLGRPKEASADLNALIELCPKREQSDCFRTEICEILNLEGAEDPSFSKFRRYCK